MKNNLARVVRQEEDSLHVVRKVVHACEEVKGKDVSVLDVRRVADFADYFVLVSGRSDRQVQGITNRIIDELHELGIKQISVEGYQQGQWVLIDCADVVVHVFYEPLRSHYDVDSLWIRGRRVEAPV